MAINLCSTSTLSGGFVKILTYGKAGVGKTRLISTLENPCVVAVESGLLSLASFEIPFITIRNSADVLEAHRWFKSSEEAKQFNVACLDSVSEMGEIILAEEMKLTTDGRRAYGQMGIKARAIINDFLELPMHVYMTAHVSQVQDETGKILFGADMPGQAFGQKMPYKFDEFLALRVERDPQGNIHRALQTNEDGQWNAKDRSGKLNPAWEPPDLGQIIRKIGGTL